MTDVMIGDEILQIAMELEETGQVFYQAMAAASGHEAVAELCRRLGEKEVEHYNTFKQMREVLPGRPDDRPLTCEELDLAQAGINERVIPDAEVAVQVASKGSLAEVLELAIKLENDSIEFYKRVLGAVQGEDARILRQVIEEEQVHAQELTVARRAV